MEFQMGVPSQEQVRERRHRTFRTVADFLDVPATEIGPCLRTFHQWLQRGQALRAEAVRAGVDPASLNFTAFTWHARAEPSTKRPKVAHPASTPIEELGLRPGVLHELRALHLHALEDFAEASEDELRRIPNLGQATVVQIRSYLHALGLDFRESPHPARRADQRARIARKLPPEARRVTDDSSIAERTSSDET